MKQVPNTTNMLIDKEKGTLIRTGVESIMNPDDTNALETALQIKEKNGAHMLTNNSSEPMHYIDVDTVNLSDVILYPDSGNVRVMAENMYKSFKLESEVNYLDGE